MRALSPGRYVIPSDVFCCPNKGERLIQEERIEPIRTSQLQSPLGVVVGDKEFQTSKNIYADQKCSLSYMPQNTDPANKNENTRLLAKSDTKSVNDGTEMNEDDFLIASPAFKSLETKERRKVRNRVLAREFRSRRKEYIDKLEYHVISLAVETDNLRAQNCALDKENTGLQNLLSTLMGSAEYTGFVEEAFANSSNF
ncbi:basic-leucine zipper transcription factor [Penicillium brevicompactum]|uniref:Basic-leucine zipper transcription factor n=1 Tax=Penicillium brevicompactum TaxID=5074 RepID=A0A9W9R595_PENBR|nr:basic-leucine zipper transcription factor [Penicillium brevicompactum]